MKLKINTNSGFCKNCFNLRREGSAYCGNCSGEKFPVYIYGEDPPFIDFIKKSFKVNDDTVYTYGDTIYYKGGELSDSLISHEITHVLQQTKMGKDEWWEKYLEDEKFRLDQEVEAYRNQYKAGELSGVKGLNLLLDKISKDLSSGLYGYIISYEEAKKLIKN